MAFNEGFRVAACGCAACRAAFPNEQPWAFDTDASHEDPVAAPPPTLTQNQINNGLLEPNRLWSNAQFTFSIPGAGATFALFSPS